MLEKRCQDTVPSLEQVQQTYKSFRIPKTFPSEPVVDDYLTQCVRNQYWVGTTVAQSLNERAGEGVFATIPFWKYQVVVEYHGKRMATIEANVLLRSLLGEQDGSNYFLTVDPDVTIDAREEACACHPHQPCFGRLVTHKANEDGPNLKSKVSVVDGLKRPFLVATRDITVGEELYFDYGVRPGQYNEGHEQIFLLPEKARKRKRGVEVLMPLTTEKMQEEVRSEDAMEETPIEVSSGDSSEVTQRRWWEPMPNVKLNENSDSSSDESNESQELSVILQQVAGGSGKKAKKTRHMKIEDCSKGFKALAEQLSATQEKKKRKKKRSKMSQEDDWKVTKLQ
ncbi:hypothetical protein QYM36_014892 [Artemia franciscana]|uniref:SET domain-containing protein n=1 Tax=Artemia franciscana TaxID=6661 RepID=A0AA88H813_ARTSF|nr:hypothetical protein QYM36_014892 [Artemia franciscana]